MTDSELMKQDKDNAEMERQLNRAWDKWNMVLPEPPSTPNISFTVGFKMAYTLNKNKL